ncbi:DNA primase [Corynebacterium sp. TAE3-ERU12]|nr:DNA primase [Corynebacterium sp. TAE3-ERU12]
MSKGRIPDSDVRAIRENTPIEEVVSEYVQLKSAGADSLKGLSPFKDERTPSFHVRPNHGYYHCFSTDKGGDVFDFLMEMEQLTFPEAVEACADRIGYRINYEGGGTGRREDHGSRRRLLAANNEAQKFYAQQLDTPDAQVARDFLKDRGFTREHAHTFGCGYAPAGWDTLSKHLMRLGYTEKELEQAGLAKPSSRGSIIDRFHRRLLWPIRNMAGDVIGFGARKLFDDDKLGKYMNTPETMLYKKSEVLFGIDLAKRDIATSHRAIVVEGYTDVMAMHAAGETTAVAACGTAFGERHLQLLRRLMLDDDFFRGEIIYTFDGDEAGQKAAMRAFEGSQEFTGQSFVAVAPPGEDPCDLRLERGDEAVRDLVAQRTAIVDFVLRTLLTDFDTDTPNGRVNAIRRVVPVLADIRDTALRDEYARVVAGWIGYHDEAELVRQVREQANAPKKEDPAQRRRRRLAEQKDRDEQQSAKPRISRPDPRDKTLQFQREAMRVAVQEPSVMGPVFDELAPEVFTHPAFQAIFAAMKKAGGAADSAGGGQWIADLYEAVDDPTVQSLITELGVEDIPVDPDQIEAYAAGLIARLQATWVSGQISQVRGALTRMNPERDTANYNRLFADLISLEQYRRELNEEAQRGPNPH